MHDQYYDAIKGWTETNSRWYEAIIERLHVPNPERHDQVVKWLYDNIDKCERHCRWCRTPGGTRVKFRYERDYIWFNLTWK